MVCPVRPSDFVEEDTGSLGTIFRALRLHGSEGRACKCPVNGSKELGFITL